MRIYCTVLLRNLNCSTAHTKIYSLDTTFRNTAMPQLLCIDGAPLLHSCIYTTHELYSVELHHYRVCHTMLVYTWHTVCHLRLRSSMRFQIYMVPDEKVHIYSWRASTVAASDGPLLSFPNYGCSALPYSPNTSPALHDSWNLCTISIDNTWQQKNVSFEGRPGYNTLPCL